MSRLAAEKKEETKETGKKSRDLATQGYTRKSKTARF
jgi:hypothetical protein